MDLPRFKDLKTTESGRVNQTGCFWLFLGRTYLASKKYKGSCRYLQKNHWLWNNIIDPDYQSLFLLSGKTVKRIYFHFSICRIWREVLSTTCFSCKERWLVYYQCCRISFAAYQFKDGTNFSYDSPMYNPKNLGQNRDPRLDYTIYYDGAMFHGSRYVCHPWFRSGDKVAGGQTTQTGFMMRSILMNLIQEILIAMVWIFPLSVMQKFYWVIWKQKWRLAMQLHRICWMLPSIR